MKNLILIRHAKSSWEEPISDKDRGLTERGKNDAALVSLYCSNLINDNFVLFSSSARRAFDTATIFAYNFSFSLNDIIIKENLYTFDENLLEKMIRSLSNDLENVILFGHNAAITNFVNKFGDIFIENVPTSGLVWIKFDSHEWKLLTKGKTQKVQFPRDLKI
ncbi:MAG: histidine phosphatase family protein [Flavobacterium sp.]|jgi:phosphohistidine phosphatase|nr:histidine phosphatase family protein [Flavobacterium sp.]